MRTLLALIIALSLPCFCPAKRDPSKPPKPTPTPVAASVLEDCMRKLDSPDANVRRDACVRLGRMKQQAHGASWGLVNRLADSDQSVRDAAFKALRKFRKDPSVQQTLGQGLKLANRDARKQCVAILADSGPSARPFLEDAASDFDPEISESAKAALRAIHPEPSPTQVFPTPPPGPQPVYQSAPPSQPPAPVDVLGFGPQTANRSKQETLAALSKITADDPTALRSVFPIKQILNESDADLRPAARAALNRILKPSDDSGYFFEMDLRTDREKLNLYGAVSHVIQTNEDDRSTQEWTFDSRGNLSGQQSYDAGGNPSSSLTYTRDAKGNVTDVMTKSPGGLTLGETKIAWDDKGNRISETVYDPATFQPDIRRSYTYDAGNHLTRYEEIQGAQLEPLVLEFDINGQGKVAQRQVKRGRMDPVLVTELEYDARGNTRTKREYVDNLPLASSGAAFYKTDEGDFGARKVQKYYWTYGVNDKDEIVEKDLYWMKGLLEKTWRLDYDQWRNVTREIVRDDEGGLISDMNFKWDAWKNPLSRSGAVFVDRRGQMESSSLTYDSQGNWTRWMGVNADFSRKPTQSRKIEYFK